MAHHAGDPARVGGAAAHDAADLLAQGADARPLGPRMVVVIDRAARVPTGADGDRQAALELVVIVAVEQVVLAVVLVVQHGVGGGEPRFEQAALGRALAAGAIGLAAPAEIGVGEIGLVLPDALVDQGLQSGAVGAGLRPEDAVAGAPRGLVRRDARRLRAPRRSAATRAASGLVVGGSSSAATARAALSNRSISPGKASRKKPEMRSVTSTRGRSSTDGGRISKPVTRPLAPLPDRPHADQRQRLGDVVAAGAHVRGAPGREREPRRIVAVLLGVALDAAAPAECQPSCQAAGVGTARVSTE